MKGAKDTTLAQGERLSDKEIDAFVLATNNVYRIVTQQRLDLNEAKRLLHLVSAQAKKGEAVDVGQVDGFLERPW
jgi:hypothetical protein